MPVLTSDVLDFLRDRIIKARFDETEAFSAWLLARSATPSQRALLWDVYLAKRAACDRACDVYRLEDTDRARLSA